jgi:hypothetical protein
MCRKTESAVDGQVGVAQGDGGFFSVRVRGPARSSRRSCGFQASVPKSVPVTARPRATEGYSHC